MDVASHSDNGKGYAPDGIDMTVPPRVVESETVYTGAIFKVVDMRIELTRNDGTHSVIRRQLIEHAPCVVMLVHDERNDRYLVTREYRVGTGSFTYGLPAGLIDGQEDPRHAALRELHEETGIVPDGDPWIDMAAECYSSEGMTDELAHIMVIHLDRWHQGRTEFDADEYVDSAWVGWDRLRALPITASNSVIAIQHEALRRQDNAAR